jgi:hypothetical protein
MTELVDKGYIAYFNITDALESGDPAQTLGALEALGLSREIIEAMSDEERERLSMVLNKYTGPYIVNFKGIFEELTNNPSILSHEIEIPTEIAPRTDSISSPNVTTPWSKDYITEVIEDLEKRLLEIAHKDFAAFLRINNALKNGDPSSVLDALEKLGIPRETTENMDGEKRELLSAMLSAITGRKAIEDLNDEERELFKAVLGGVAGKKTIEDMVDEEHELLAAALSRITGRSLGDFKDIFEEVVNNPTAFSFQTL